MNQPADRAPIAAGDPGDFTDRRAGPPKRLNVERFFHPNQPRYLPAAIGRLRQRAPCHTSGQAEHFQTVDRLRTHAQVRTFKPGLPGHFHTVAGTCRTLELQLELNLTATPIQLFLTAWCSMEMP